jgi:nondiscriminating glutamyl-tRNA synthetase
LSVRVRFAPSPTGHLHVGGARTALFNWLFARHHHGTFVLRVEDTDQARSTRESEELVLADLRWLGLQWDEGPDVGGPDGPYRQSERRDGYGKLAAELVAGGFAYPCFCSEEELERKREEAERASRPPHYDLTCHRLSTAERERRVAAGDSHAIRFHVPKEEAAPFDADVTIDDMVRGEVSWGKESLGDFILVRSDGMPTYNFSVVADDHAMEITHVIRAEEHLTNTHRQVLIYRAMGWTPPRFAHVSLILGSDRSKLSKRHGATSVNAYADDGYLAQALTNYLALLGWSSPNGVELLTREELVREFSLARVNSAPAVFDVQKLAWMNGQYLHDLSGEELALLASRLFVEKGLLLDPADDLALDWLSEALELVKTAAHRWTELPQLLGGGLFFSYDPAPIFEDPDNRKVVEEPSAAAVIDSLERILPAGSPASPDDYPLFVEALKSASGQKGKKLFMPLRLILTGSIHGPELHRAVPLMQQGSAIGGLSPVLSPAERVRRFRQAQASR